MVDPVLVMTRHNRGKGLFFLDLHRGAHFSVALRPPPHEAQPMDMANIKEDSKRQLPESSVASTACFRAHHALSDGAVNPNVVGR